MAQRGFETFLPPSSAPLIGREREMAQLRQQLDAARSGRFAISLVTGEPGVGKTRLLSAILAEAEQSGAQTLRGGASDAEGMPPYLPFLEALGTTLRTAELGWLRDTVGPWRIPLTGIFPDISERLGPASDDIALPVEQARLRLFEGVGAVLRGIAQAAPLILQLDDLHWADSATLALLTYLPRVLEGSPILVLGAYRSGDADQSAALTRALSELNRQRLATTISLGPFSLTETTTLAAAVLGGPVDATLAQWVQARSEGNPFFAEEILRGSLERGDIVTPDGTARLTGDQAVQPPRSVVDAIQVRLGQAAETDPDLLRTAAAIGRQFDLALLAEVTGRDLDEVEAALIPFNQRGILRYQGDEIAFSHDLIRQTLYQQIPPIRRRRLHGFIGRAIERQGRINVDTLTALAFHFGRSGDRERAITFSQAAADQALAQYGAEQAIQLYRSALDLSTSNDPVRGELLMGIGRAAAQAGDFAEAATSYQAARAAFEQHENRTGAAGACHQLGLMSYRLGAMDAAQSAYQAGLRLLDDSRQAELVTLLADYALLMGTVFSQFSLATELGSRALAIAQEGGTPQLLAVAQRTLGNVLAVSDELDAAENHLRQALAVAVQSDLLYEVVQCAHGLYTLAYRRADPRGMYENAQIVLRYAEQCHELFYRCQILSSVAIANAAFGRWDECLTAQRTAQSLADRLNLPVMNQFLTFNHGIALIVHGDINEAVEVLDRAAEQPIALGPIFETIWIGALALARVLAGQGEAARPILNRLEAKVVRGGIDQMELVEALIVLGMSASILADQERAAWCFEQLIPHRGRAAGTVTVDQVLGRLAWLLGDRSAADAYLASAETMAREAGVLTEIGRVLALQAEIAIGDGLSGRERGLQLLHEARAVFESIGWEADAARVRARINSLTQPSAKLERPAGLSDREIEVLRLVAAGHSNREIAELLVITEKTVVNHVTSIFNKTGATNRAAATAFALRHGLAE